MKGYYVEIISWVNIDEYKDDVYSGISKKFILESSEYRWIYSIYESSKKITEMISIISPTVILVHSPNMLWLITRLRMNIPVLHILHSYEDLKISNLKYFAYRLATAWIVKYLNAKTIVVNDAMKENASLFYFIRKKEIHTIDNGVDYPEASVCYKNIKNINIIMVGTLSPSKGQRYGIEAMRLLLKKLPNAKLSIVGDGNDMLVLKKMINNYGLKGKIHLMGQRHDIFNLLYDSNLLWHLSLSEAMPMVILEAMSIGVPVIGFNVRGINSIVQDGITGILIPYGDVNLISEKSFNLLKDQNLWELMSKSSIDLVRNKYSKKNMVNSYINLIQNVSY